jgi:hypothetical protein
MPNLRKRPSNSPVVEVKLRKVIPVLPSSEMEATHLLEDLTSMGCPGFLNKPWGFKEEKMVREIIGTPSNEWDGTIRGRPNKWTEDNWREVYNFRSGGLGMASRKDEYIRGKFKGPPNPKDGYAVEDCINSRQRRILEFLIPVLHPEKPTRVTITLGNLIFGALSGNRKADWGRIVFDLVAQLTSRVGKSRATPVSPYLFHLYHKEELLSGEEEKTWNAQEMLLKYGESETDDEAPSESGSEEEEEEEEDTPMPPTKRTKMKSTSKSPQGKGKSPMPESPPKGKDPEPEPGSAEPESSDPFTTMIKILEISRDEWASKSCLLKEIAKLVGYVPGSDLAARVAECIQDPVETERLKEQNRNLIDEVDRLTIELLKTKDEAANNREIAMNVLKVSERIRATVGQPGEAVSKAKLFDAKVHEDKKLSGSRILRILSDFAERIEGVLKEIRVTAGRIDECSNRLARSPNPKSFRLSDLSLPDVFPDVPATGDPKFATPESKKSEGEPSRSLTEVFETMEPGRKSPSVGPTV